MQTTTASETVSAVRWHVVAWREKTFQAAPGEPIRAGGCCDRCAQSIRYVVTVKSTDGQVLDVGQDCALTLSGGPELAEIRRAERAYQEELYRNSPEGQARAQERRDREAAKAARAAEAETKHALLLAYLRILIASPNVSEFGKNVPSHIEQRLMAGDELRDFDDDQIASLCLSSALACLPETSEHVGRVGDRIEREAILEAMIPVETAYGISYVQKFRSRAGECLVWFSAGGELGRNHIGQWVRIKGTVKAHDTYNGTKQTKLARCKTTFL